MLYGNYARWGANNEIRRITPLLLFQLENREGTWPPPGGYAAPATPCANDTLYLLAWDHDRKAQRSFHANRFSPCATAPWMRPHFTDASESEWRGLLRRTARRLLEAGVEPVA